jgi:hypothetical protein
LGESSENFLRGILPILLFGNSVDGKLAGLDGRTKGLVRLRRLSVFLVCSARFARFARAHFAQFRIPDISGHFRPSDHYVRTPDGQNRTRGL